MSTLTLHANTVLTKGQTEEARHSLVTKTSMVPISYNCATALMVDEIVKVQEIVNLKSKRLACHTIYLTKSFLRGRFSIEVLLRIKDTFSSVPYTQPVKLRFLYKTYLSLCHRMLGVIWYSTNRVPANFIWKNSRQKEGRIKNKEARIEESTAGRKHARKKMRRKREGGREGGHKEGIKDNF
ncbi:hypothetical protein XENOCAPTIV_010727 [Xenoophorus captivus]|uniref:Uncharacterized protein n=1 Tax=Xenoophorus captivus TaxID=1517983 RepID=A0ABV0QA73_9TELE